MNRTLRLLKSNISIAVSEPSQEITSQSIANGLIVPSASYQLIPGHSQANIIDIDALLIWFLPYSKYSILTKIKAHRHNSALHHHQPKQITGSASRQVHALRSEISRNTDMSMQGVEYRQNIDVISFILPAKILSIARDPFFSQRNSSWIILSSTQQL